MTEIRLPALLDEEMHERARLHPVEARAQMRLNALSTAELTLDEEDAQIRVRDMAALYGPQGPLGIFRVSALRAAGDGLRLAEMEHGLCTLEDDVTPPGTVLQGPIGDVAATLLQWQSRPMWKLGTVESGMILAETEADGANLLETLLAVLAIDESLMIETDQRALPWVLHLKKMPQGTDCECRLNRNLDGVTVTLDGSELCTRLTAVLPDGTSVTRDGDTIGAWGVVHRAMTLDENQDPETEIPKYLEEHKNPGVSVELEAVALAALTGEPLDKFSLGGLCRVALPDWNAVISERVITMAYDDLFGEPGRVKLTLCSQTLDASTLLARLRAEQRRSGKRMFRFIRETKNGVEILAEEILLRATKTEVAELNGVLTDKISEVSVELDGAKAQLRLKASQEYVDQRLSATELLLDGANARIDANALRIDEANKQISAASLAIDGANARIDAEAKRIDEANGTVTAVSQTLDAVKGEISQKVSKDGLISEINQSAEKIRISASRIDLDGYVTAKALEADIANFKREYAGQFTTSHLFAEDGHFATLNVSGTLTADVIMGGSNVNLSIHYHEFTVDGGTVTIGGPSATPGSFNIADTKFYKDGVSAAARAVKVSEWENEYYPDDKNVHITATLSTGVVQEYDLGVAGVYNDGAKSVYFEKFEWTYPAPNTAMLTITLSNGKKTSRSTTIK